MNPTDLINLYNKKDYKSVIKHCEKKLKGREKNNPFYLSLMGGALLETQRTERSLQYFQRALRQDNSPLNAYNLGKAWLKLGDFNKSIPLFEFYRRSYSSDIDAILNLSFAKTKTKDYEGAAQLLLDAKKTYPTDHRILKNLALNSIESRDYISALNYLETGISTNDRDLDLVLTYAKLLDQLQRIEHSYHWLNHVIGIDPKNQNANFLLGKIIAQHSIDADPQCHLEIAVAGEDKAIAESALSVSMAYFDKTKNWTSLKAIIGQVQTSTHSKWLVDSSDARSFAMAVRTCDWAKIDASKPDNFVSQLDPFIAAHVTEDPKFLQKVCRLRVGATEGIVSEDSPRYVRHDSVARPLKIGFFAGEFYNHPVSLLLMPVLRELAKTEVQTFAFSFTKAGDEITEIVKMHVLDFIDLTKLNDIEIVNIVRKYELDIAIDLNGHTGDNHLSIFNSRIAPYQVSYLGFPATTGCSSIDAILLDDVVAPEELANDFDERVLRIPGGFMPRDYSVVPGTGLVRADYGLPDGRAVLACYHKPEKITERIFTAWCKICRSVDGIIWLPEMDIEVFERLRASAVTRGLSSDQLLMANRVQSIEEHLGRLALADLFLDSYPYGGHTTFSDALFSGLPCITLYGETSVSRVGFSLLRQYNLDEYAFDNISGFIGAAINLINHPAELENLKHTLVKHRQINSQSYSSEYAMAFYNVLAEAYAERLDLAQISKQ